ncbi:MAG TPA: hypothetical protein VFA26_05500 [Gemmataceae bacterium]|nr:hypothetical protein [Gemmataceae bacterium]
MSHETRLSSAPRPAWLSPFRQAARWLRRLRGPRPAPEYLAEFPPPPHVVDHPGVQVVVISNDTISGDNSAPWVPADNQYFEIGSAEEMVALLEAGHAPGSIDVLILGGHGERAGAGIRAIAWETGEEVYINQAMDEGLAARLRQRLRGEAEVYIAACGSGGDQGLMRELARKLGCRVTATPGCVYADYSADAPWVTVAPDA